MAEANSPEFSEHEPPAGPPLHPADPWLWCLILTLLFAGIASIRLTIPDSAYFDEVHYLPAARDLIEVWKGGEAPYNNPEHPMLGKTLIALGIALFGDNPLGWRIMPLLAGTLAMVASMRAMWHASLDRHATIYFGVLLFTGFHLFVASRIAMLDVFMVSFLALAAWQFASAIRRPEQGRWRLAVTGVAIGCALGAKWNAAALAGMFGITFFIARAFAGRRRLILSRRGAPVPGISLLEAFVWLGILPLIVYALTFAPGYWLGTELRPSSLMQGGIILLHQEIFSLQQQVLTPHPYQSTWEQWALNTRSIWYLYEEIDGVDRGIVLLGNPLTMLLGLPAVIWCLVAGIYHRDWARLAVALGYCVTLGFWIVAPKPIQFYYHYLMPSFFLLGALAFSLSDVREAGWPKLSYFVVAASAGMFALFYTILSAGPLVPPTSFRDWMWLESWV